MSRADLPEISLVVPVFDEVGAAGPLVREIAAAFVGRPVEIIFVDDASGDGTRESLMELKGEFPQLRVLWHRRNAGQSRAIRTGVVAARSAVVITLDGDGQNSPADALKLAARLADGPPSLGLVSGERMDRQDTISRRWAARVANALRRRVLMDGAADTGCGLKAFRREAYLALPYFDHMHRYLPALMLREGYGVVFEPVSHRPRITGRSKYTNAGRLRDAIRDLTGVLWLKARFRDPGETNEA